MLHIKDIEAFARINEALFSPSAPARGDQGDVPAAQAAALLARLMTMQPAEPARTEKPSAEIVPFVPPKEREAVDKEAESVGGAGYDFDLAPSRPMTMAGLFSRMMFGRR